MGADVCAAFVVVICREYTGGGDGIFRSEY